MDDGEKVEENEEDKLVEEVADTDCEDAKEEWQRIKERHINAALEADPVDIAVLRREAVCNGGLLSTEIRRKVWPKLVGVNRFGIKKYTGPALTSHKETAQVQLDVNRCGRRMPPELSAEQRKVTQEKLSRVILRLLAEQKDICYYQGLHEVVLTFLLVLGEELTYAVLKKLTQYHLRDFLDANMGKTKEVIAYISPLLSLVDSELEEFITRSDCAYYFSLSWLITWYSHVVDNQEHAARLTDFFLASHPMMPVYLATAIIADRRSEVLAQECEISAVHGLLSKLPDDLDYEAAIITASRLFNQYPLPVVAATTHLKFNSSYMNYNHSSFLRRTNRQRPDHILATLPEDPPWLSWAFLYRLLTSRYTVSVVVGVVSIATYYWLYHIRLSTNPAISDH